MHLNYERLATHRRHQSQDCNLDGVPNRRAAGVDRERRPRDEEKE
jgi:hypothetical protein